MSRPPIQTSTGGGLDQPQDRPPATGLAAAGFAHEGKGFADVEGKAHILDRVDLRHGAPQDAAFDGEACREVFDLQQHLGLAGHGRACGHFGPRGLVADQAHPFGAALPFISPSLGTAANSALV
jgi:hypothetical protein